MPTDPPLTIVTALIQPHMEGRVIHALHDLGEFPGFSLTEVRGQGRGRGAGGSYVATEYDFAFQRHLQMQIVCHASMAAEICRRIAAAAWTGRKGDGVIYTAAAESLMIRRPVRPLPRTPS